MEPIYTLARLRLHKPQPPFLLGGEFLRYQHRCFLGDALTRLEICAPESLFEKISPGDLVTIRVIASVDGESVCCETVTKVVDATVERPPPSPHAVGFTQFVREVREFLRTLGLQEIMTPTLVACPGLEPHLEPFATLLTKGHEQRTVYLPTSPEIHLKKALAFGYTDIFEIKSCFRRGEFSQAHENEFTMLEWYRGFADLRLIRADLQALVTACGGALIRETTFKAIFKEMVEFDLTPQTTREDLHSLCVRLNIPTLEQDSFDDLFHRVLIERLEPHWRNLSEPLLVHGFPPSQAALARLTDDGWADRFELYWRGLELANAFNEVNDPDVQIARWRAEQNERRHLGTSDVPDDPGLITALRQGMPPSGGIALGLERLYMAIHGVGEIRELKLFTTDLHFHFR